MTFAFCYRVRLGLVSVAAIISGHKDRKRNVLLSRLMEVDGIAVSRTQTVSECHCKCQGSLRQHAGKSSDML